MPEDGNRYLTYGELAERLVPFVKDMGGLDTLTNNGPAHVLVLVMKPISYARHRFPPDVIRHAVWLYLRFTLSFRDVEDLLAERGLMVSNELIRRWVFKFGPIIAKNLRQSRPKAYSRWHLDEMVVSIAGRQMCMWRAVDSEGEVLEILVQPHRDKAAADAALPAGERHRLSLTLRQLLCDGRGRHAAYCMRFYACCARSSSR